MFDLRGYDYIVDAIDSMESKLLLIEQAKIMPYAGNLLSGNRGKTESFQI